MTTDVLKLSFCLLFFSSGGPAIAYELATHGAVTSEAYKRSVLRDNELLKQLGIDLQTKPEEPFGSIYYDVGANVGTRKSNKFEDSIIQRLGVQPLSLPGWLLRGAIREDDWIPGPNPWVTDPDPDIGAVFRARSLNHFYDPQFDSPLKILGELGAKAQEWGTTRKPAGHNHYTVLDAREAMYRALTGQNKEGGAVAATQDERNKYWATMFRALGNVVHLVQDMAQPQHTRNDPHAGERFDGDRPLRGHKSVYEAYVEASATGGFFDTKDAVVESKPIRVRPISWSGIFENERKQYDKGGYPIPRFTDYISFWTTRHLGEGLDARRGLADYSNRGFFSAGTNLDSDYPSAVPETNITGTAAISYGWEGESSSEAVPPILVLIGNVPDKLSGGKTESGVPLSTDGPRCQDSCRL